LVDFREWYGQSPKIWCQGASFDIPILQEAYARCNMEPPWKFWTVRDTRTVYDIANFNSKDLPATNLHHALFDCQHQIHAIKIALSKIKK
ncbi:MAG: 3'-5' exoribonuclease, partial [Verrucomicrobia bacterium]|nr:3'-5' exoribonuclease [Verrucomicrobiota bacterium]